MFQALGIAVAILLQVSGAFACAPPDAAHLSRHLAAVNDFRSTAGLPDLALSENLTRAAQNHACDMGQRGYFSHASPDGSTMADRLRSAGLSGICRVAENIAKGQADISQAMRSWTGSPGHRQNLLDRRLTLVGFGLGPGNVWVQLFAGPCA